MKIAQNLTELTGHTPLVRLNKINTGKAEVVLKLEYYNPANSIKDRPALQMILDAEQEGKINKDTVILEPTSGNMGIGLSMICAIRGYKIIITMPDTMSSERRMMMKLYGAELVLTPGKDGMKGAVDKALELQKKYPNSFIPSQFDNPSNPKAHYLNTAKEIWEDTDGRVDIFAAGVGTGGTICGVAKRLKENKPEVKAYAIEPETSRVLSGISVGSHKIQGIGANFIPKNYNSELVDGIIPVSNEDAIQTARNLALKEGIAAGFSGGANVWAAIKLSERPENEGKLIVTVIPDFGERYLSSELYK